MNGAHLVVEVIILNHAAVWRVSQYYSISSLQKCTEVCVCVCVFVGDRLRQRLREYPSPDLDAPLIPIKMRAV